MTTAAEGAAAAKDAVNYGWEYTKIGLTVGGSLFTGLSLLLGGAWIVRLKRGAEHADECVEHLQECARQGTDALRKFAQGDDAEAKKAAYLMATARDKLGQEVNMRFRASKRLSQINRNIAALDLALDRADPTGEHITAAQAEQFDGCKSAIETAQTVCRASILLASQTPAYHFWGKHH